MVQPPARSHPSSNSRGLPQEATKEETRPHPLAHDTHSDLEHQAQGAQGCPIQPSSLGRKQQKTRNPSGFVAKPSRNRSGAIPGGSAAGVLLCCFRKKLEEQQDKKADAAKNAKRSLEVKHLPSFSLTLQDTHSSSPRACQTRMAKNTRSTPTRTQKKGPLNKPGI